MSRRLLASTTWWNEIYSLFERCAVPHSKFNSLRSFQSIVVGRRFDYSKSKHLLDECENNIDFLCDGKSMMAVVHFTNVTTALNIACGWVVPHRGSYVCGIYTVVVTKQLHLCRIQTAIQRQHWRQQWR